MWRDDQTGAIGCSRRCCVDAAGAKTQVIHRQQLISGRGPTYSLLVGN
jgi:hypothetical protein